MRTSSRRDADVESVPDLALDSRLCLALHRTARAMDAAYRPFLDDLGLTYPQHLVLVALLETSPLAVRDIGARLGLASSTLSPLLGRLEEQALVRRDRSRFDERRVDVVLTQTGLALARRASTVGAQVCQATGLDESAQRVLVDQLHGIIGGLTAGVADAD